MGGLVDFFLLKVGFCTFSRVSKVTPVTWARVKGIDLDTNNVVVDGKIDHPDNNTAMK